ncbi:hypothetical protein H0E87_026002, partial [Populus deltoides]
WLLVSRGCYCHALLGLALLNFSLVKMHVPVRYVNCGCYRSSMLLLHAVLFAQLHVLVEFDALVAAGFVLNSLKLASGYSGSWMLASQLGTLLLSTGLAMSSSDLSVLMGAAFALGCPVSLVVLNALPPAGAPACCHSVILFMEIDFVYFGGQCCIAVQFCFAIPALA